MGTLLWPLLLLGLLGQVAQGDQSKELPSDSHQVRWVENFDHLAHVSHEATDVHPVVFLFLGKEQPIKGFPLKVLKETAMNKKTEGALFAITNNQTVVKEFWPSGLPDPPRMVIMRAFEETQRLEIEWNLFTEPTGDSEKLADFINAHAFHRVHEVTGVNVALLHRREPAIKCVWFGLASSQSFRKTTLPMLRELADKFKNKIMFMYVDKDQKRLIQKASGKEEPLDEVLPAFRMFVANKDGSLGRILKSAPVDKERQVVVAAREMTHPRFAPQFINKFVDESFAKLAGGEKHDEL
jgi:hypothetical protein